MSSAFTQYGDILQHEAADGPDRIVEEVRELGFSVTDPLFGESELVEMRQSGDTLLETQSAEFGASAMEAISESNIVRALLAYDDRFLRAITHPSVLAIVERLLGPYFIVNQQNLIINKPGDPHHQTTWHRDLPYQNYTSSQPLAISVLMCVDAFSEENGGTYVLPFSHRQSVIPSPDYVERHRVQVESAAGSAIVFDSMLVHRAGTNRSGEVRRALNNVYSIPLLKQQIDLPRMMANRVSPENAHYRLLGFDSAVPETVQAWRERRLRRTRAE